MSDPTKILDYGRRRDREIQREQAAKILAEAGISKAEQAGAIYDDDEFTEDNPGWSEP